MAGGPEEIIRCECHHCGSKSLCWHFTADCGGDDIALCMRCLTEITEEIEVLERHKQD